MIGLWLLYNIAVAPLLFAINRFRLPLLPFAFIFAAYALVKARVTPLWSILLLVPYLDVVVLWVIAFLRWPRIDGQRPHVVHRG